MTTVSRRRIRLKIDYAKRTVEQIEDVNTNSTPELWKGNDVQFEIGIFFNDTIISDVSNLASVSLAVRETNATGTLLMTKTVSGASITNCTGANWTDGTSQHALLTFTGAEANIDAGTHWLVVTVLTTDSPARFITLGATKITITEDGDGNEADAQAADGTAYTKDQADARFVQIHADLAEWQWKNGRWYVFNPDDSLWYPLAVRTVDSTPVLTIGTGVATP